MVSRRLNNGVNQLEGPGPDQITYALEPSAYSTYWLGMLSMTFGLVGAGME